MFSGKQRGQKRTAIFISTFLNVDFILSTFFTKPREAAMIDKGFLSVVQRKDEDRMKRIFFLGVLVVLMAIVVVPSPTTEAADTASTGASLSVSGRGSVQGAADQAMISLGVTTHSVVAREAQETNASASQRICDALADLGIAARDIQTQNYNFSPEYSYEDAQRGTITGYTVNNTILVRIQDITKIGQIIDTALTNGANNVNSLDFSIRDPRSLRREALTAAVKDAREKADIIARAIGKSIVGVVNVSENTAIMPPYPMERLMASAVASDATPIEGGTLTLTADVRVEFRLAD